MAEDLEWMTKQRDTLKTELDALNPKHDETVKSLNDCRTANKHLTEFAEKCKADLSQINSNLQTSLDRLEIAGKRIGQLEYDLSRAQNIISLQQSRLKRAHALAAEVLADAVNENIQQG